jgi:hypothetical protein
MYRWLALIIVLALSDVAGAAPRTGSTNWNDWSVGWTVGSASEGLEIRNVFWKGVKVLYKGSMPVIRVKYDANACGPYADRIGWTNIYDTPWAPCQGEKVCLRDWGGNILEIGAYAKLGKYNIYQAWYFTKSGSLEAKMWSQGWHCQVSHRHHPYWRLDFDIDGIPNRIWRFHKPGSTWVWQQYQTERDQSVSGLANVGWWIENAAGTHHVIVRPGMTENPDAFAPYDVAVRLYRAVEDNGWPWGATGQLGYGNNEPLWNADNVFWWTAHLSHNWNGDDPQGTLWHWVGPVVYMGW